MTAINTQFSVTGGETQRAPNNAFLPGERKISILPAPFTGVPSPAQWSGQNVWLLVPAFTAPSNQYDTTIAPAIKNTNPNDVIFAVDWTQVSGSLDSAVVAVAKGDNYRSASWITPVANAIRDKLISWGMPAAALNIIGHSLGAYLSSEIAASFSAVGGQVGSVTALDPASNNFAARDRSPYDKTNGYDTDLSNGYVLDNKGGIADPVKRFDLGTTVSRSFNGKMSLSGNETQSGTAKESFLFDFGTAALDVLGQRDEHGRVVTAYQNLITTDANGNSRLATNILGVNDTLADHQFRPDFYKGGFPNSVQVHEGIIPVDAQNNPLFLVAAKPNNGINGLNDRFIYATNGNDDLDARVSANPISSYYSNNGNHTYYLGYGDDRLFAGTGNDTIFGGDGNDTIDGGNGNNTIFGEEGNDTIYGGFNNDIIYGGAGNNQLFGEYGNDSLTGGIDNDTILGGNGDDTIFGGGGNDTLRGEADNDVLVGGSGINIMFGGLGNDIVQGGTGRNLLRGSETQNTSNPFAPEIDSLIGNTNSSLNAFYIGDGTRNWYSSHGMNDYAEIQNFNAATDVILGSVNINSQDNNPLNQTFLWSGNELVAKIDGLWASQLQFNSRSPIV